MRPLDLRFVTLLRHSFLMIQASTSPKNHDGYVRRILLAGVAGVVLPAALLGWAYLMTAFRGDSCGHLGCVGFVAVGWEVGRWVAVALGWPLLYLLRVRPAWIVAVTATAFLVAIWYYAMNRAGDPVTLILVSAVIAYPSAALATAPRLAWPWRAAIAVPFLLLLIIALFPA